MAMLLEKGTDILNLPVFNLNFRNLLTTFSVTIFLIFSHEYIIYIYHLGSRIIYPVVINDNNHSLLCDKVYLCSSHYSARDSYTVGHM